MLSTDQKGAIAELAVVHHAARLDVGVLRRLTDGHRYDLVFDFNGELLRVQCKWALRHGNVVVVRCRSCRRTATGYDRRVYTSDEVDLVAAYCLELDQCYVLPAPLFDGRSAVQLRLSRARNNQREGINWASDYEIEAKLRTEQGAVAQLGERQHGMLEATGSSPVGSTLFDAPLTGA